MGNRQPLLGVTFQGPPAPLAPEVIRVNEGQLVSFGIVFSDPDGVRVETNEVALRVLNATGPDELVLVTNPRISSSVLEDPEGDLVSILFEVVFDAEFEDVVAAIDPVPAGAANSVEWTVTPDLDGGTRYFVRAMVQDDRGSESDWSGGVSFTVRPDLQIQRESQTVFETIVPQSEGTQTEISIDAGAFNTPGSYLIRVRTINGDAYSAWSECQARVAGEGPGTGPGNGDGSESRDGSQTMGEEGCGLRCCRLRSRRSGLGRLPSALRLRVPPETPSMSLNPCEGSPALRTHRRPSDLPRAK